MADDHADNRQEPQQTDPSTGRLASGEPARSAETSVPRQRTPWDTLSARVLSFVSRKGGVGKTTSTVNLGAALALSGHSVLVVGLDPQCGAARTLGYGPENLDGGLGRIFENGASLTHLAYTTPLKSLFLVSPAVRSLADEERLAREMDERVDTFVQEIDRARNLYDTILIDCPPGLGPFTRAGLQASDSYLVPVQAEELCRDSLPQLLRFIDDFRSEVYPQQGGPETAGGPLELEGMFLTMVSTRTRMSRHVVERVGEDYAGHVFATSIPRTTRLSEMALRGKPAVIYDRRSAGSRAYFDLMDELLGRWHARLEIAEEGSVERATDENVASPGDPESRGEWLSRLTGAGGLDRPADLAREENEPDLVSLDELLAEEEAGEEPEERWEGSRWTQGRDGGHPFH
jgi:chromosome partitioning protein